MEKQFVVVQISPKNWLSRLIYDVRFTGPPQIVRAASYEEVAEFFGCKIIKIEGNGTGVLMEGRDVPVIRTGRARPGECMLLIEGATIPLVRFRVQEAEDGGSTQHPR